MLYIFYNNKNVKLKRRRNIGDKRVQQINTGQENDGGLGEVETQLRRNMYDNPIGKRIAL